MTLRTLYLAVLLCFVPAALASVLREGQQLPASQVEALGELVLAGDEFNYRTWQASRPVPLPHVLQYFPGTMQDSKIYEPFTDSLQADYTLGSYHVTTIINLDEALWGTTGFVVSEVKRSKRKFPASTMVLDESGALAREWALGDDGAGLVIMDHTGQIRLVHLGTMSEAEMGAARKLFSELMQAAAD